MKTIVKLFLSIIISCTTILCFASCKNEEEKLMDNPAQEYVIECLEKVPGILEIEAVTEDTDPMKNLNKPGWYTAHIYFSYQLVNQEDVYGDDLIDKGTDAGGSVEVYKTKSDANKRNEYLSAFDGGVLSSGSHTVVGTCVVRTSNELTATQQRLLEENIIAALQGFDDKIVDPNNSSNNGNENESGNNSSSSTTPNTNTKENAINDIENHADELLLEYPEDYFTPSYMRDYLIDVKGYTETIANYAIENSDIDWLSQASKEANVYLTYEEEFGRPASWWNPTDIEDILLGDGFSSNVVDSVMVNIDWNAQSVKYVQHLSDFYDTFNRFEARGYLENVIATEEGINYLLENSSINWRQHALNMANELWAEYREYEAMTLADIEDELSRIWQYTPAEIEYALNNITM